MSPLPIKISKDFATLFTTINPIATLALFAGLTAALTRSERHRTALRSYELRFLYPKKSRKLSGMMSATRHGGQALRGTSWPTCEGGKYPRSFSEKSQDFDNFASLFP